jgi:hypothetical protein
MAGGHGRSPQMRGRYGDYDVLANADHWDAKTRQVVMRRVEAPPEISFFDETEATTLRVFCDLVMDQVTEPKIPVLEFVDEKLKQGRLDGFRYANMPTDPETWRLVARNLDQSARAAGFEAGFAAAPVDIQRDIIDRFSRGELDWELSVKQAWSVVMRGVLEAFYAHPWAWNEIGFGGPTYPRGYARIGVGQHEVWERAPQSPERDPATVDSPHNTA